jgi:integrase
MAWVQRRARQRADGRTTVRWVVRWCDPEGRERARTFDREGAAKEHRDRVAGEVRAGVYIAPEVGRETVAAFADRWRASVADLKPSTLARLDGTLAAHVLPEWGDVPLAAVANSDVRAWMARLRRDGWSASTVRKAVSGLQRILDAAVADGRLLTNAARNVPLPVEDHGEQRFLSPTEIADLADGIRDRYRALVLVACWGGLRWGELAGLRRRRVDLARGRVQVAEVLSEVGGHVSLATPKTRASRRTVPLPGRVVAELADHLDKFVDADADALVFTGPKGGPLRRNEWRRRYWRPAVTRAGLEPLRFHDTRHTFVALAVAAGADPKQVSTRAGHSSVAFTLDRYGHLYDDADDRVTGALDAMLADSAPAARAPVVELGRDHTGQTTADGAS